MSPTTGRSDNSPQTVTQQVTVGDGVAIVPVGTTGHFQVGDFAVPFHQLQIAVDGAARNVRHLLPGVAEDFVGGQVLGDVAYA